METKTLEFFIAGITHNNRQELHKALFGRRKNFKYALSLVPEDQDGKPSLAVHIISQSAFNDSKVKHLGYIPKYHLDDVLKFISEKRLIDVKILETIDNSFNKVIFGTKLKLTYKEKEQVKVEQKEEVKEEEKPAPKVEPAIESVQAIELKIGDLEASTAPLTFIWDHLIWIEDNAYLVKTHFEDPTKLDGKAFLEKIDAKTYREKIKQRVNSNITQNIGASTS